MVKEIEELTKEVTTEDMIGRKLILRVEKPIWIDPNDPEHPWTTTPQKVESYDFIDDGSVLIYQNTDRTEEGKLTIVFVVIKPGVARRYSAGFFQEEIQRFTEEGILTLLNIESVREISIVRGNVFIADPDGKSYSRIFLPIDLNVVSTEKEYVMSNHAFQVGEKISMKNILDQYMAYAKSLEL